MSFLFLMLLGIVPCRLLFCTDLWRKNSDGQRWLVKKLNSINFKIITDHWPTNCTLHAKATYSSRSLGRLPSDSGSGPVSAFSSKCLQIRNETRSGRLITNIVGMFSISAYFLCAEIVFPRKSLCGVWKYTQCRISTYKNCKWCRALISGIAPVRLFPTSQLQQALRYFKNKVLFSKYGHLNQFI
jgi:hypothetical protein